MRVQIPLEAQRTNFWFSLAVSINMNLAFHISEDGSEISSTFCANCIKGTYSIKLVKLVTFLTVFTALFLDFPLCFLMG